MADIFELIILLVTKKEIELIARLFLASFLGGLIGYEREQFNKPAGLRTNMLVCLGAALMMVYAANAFPNPDSSARIAAGMITGIGFLGAGSIMQSKKTVRGLTTAATIWVVAIIGTAVGGGEYLGAAIATVFVLAILYFSRIEEKVVSLGLPVVAWFPIRRLPLVKKMHRVSRKTKPES